MDARLAWLSRRGIKELDLVLQGFLQEDYATATATEQQAFAALLEYQDPDILDRLFHGVEDDDAAIAAQVARPLRWLRICSNSPADSKQVPSAVRRNNGADSGGFGENRV